MGNINNKQSGPGPTFFKQLIMQYVLKRSTKKEKQTRAEIFTILKGHGMLYDMQNC